MYYLSFFRLTATAELNPLSYTTLFRSTSVVTLKPAASRVRRAASAGRSVTSGTSAVGGPAETTRSEEHMSELQSQFQPVCRLVRGEKSEQDERFDGCGIVEDRRDMYYL